MRLLTTGKEEPDEAFPELTSENWLAAFLSDLQVRRDESAERHAEEQRRLREAPPLPPEPARPARRRRFPDVFPCSHGREDLTGRERRHEIFFDGPLTDWDREFLERLRQHSDEL